MEKVFFRKIINSLNLGVIVVDNKCRILLWNNWVTDTRQHHDAVIGLDLVAAFKETISPSLLKAIKNTLDYGLPTFFSNALHKSPLPLYTFLDDTEASTRTYQSITLSALKGEAGENQCLIQISDSTTSLKRENVLKSHTEVYRRDSITDSLTGIYNRRFFNEHYKLACHQAIRHNKTLSVFLIDIDFFKQYNDNYGHIAGDEALKTITEALKSQLHRSGDVLARYGGEEFVMVFQNFSYEDSQAFAEKLRKYIFAQAIPHAYASPHCRITVSIGTCSGIPNEGIELLIKADDALYMAKRNARNCCVSLSLS